MTSYERWLLEHIELYYIWIDSNRFQWKSIWYRKSFRLQTPQLFTQTFHAAQWHSVDGSSKVRLSKSGMSCGRTVKLPSCRWYEDLVKSVTGQGDFLWKMVIIGKLLMWPQKIMWGKWILDLNQINGNNIPETNWIQLSNTSIHL